MRRMLFAYFRTPGDMISTTTATQKLFQKDFDEFGDSFVEDTTPERIKDILTEINLVCMIKPYIYLLLNLCALKLQESVIIGSEYPGIVTG